MATKKTLQDQLNRCMPIAATVGLGDLLTDLVAQNNALVADLATVRAALNVAVAKLNLDDGVTDANYAAAAVLTAAAVKDIDAR